MKVCADGGYRITFENHVKALGKTITVSEKIGPREWAVLPKRRIAERTFSWLNHSRGLAKDYEITVTSEETMVLISHAAALLKRFAAL